MSKIATLEEAIALQLCFKSGHLRSAMVEIVKGALNSEAPSFYPDQVDFSALPLESKNLIGSSFRILLRAGIIGKTGEYRNSLVPGQHGRTIWGYRVTNSSLARSFLKANSVTPVIGQQEFAL